MTTVPAASITAATATTPYTSNRRSARISDRGGSVPSVHLACSASAAATTAIDTTKCRDTMAGLRLVSTTIPPSTICASTPPGCAAASQTRSARRRPAGRNRQAATRTATATTVTATVTMRLPNSIQVWNIGSPRVCAAIRLLRVHCGQSGQPSPDLLSRTAAPVTMITAVDTTPASAIARIAAGVGAQIASTPRRRAAATAPVPRRASAPTAAGAGGSGLVSGGVCSACTPLW